MSTWIKVGRYHLVTKQLYVVLPWVWLAFAFAVDAIIMGLTPAGHSAHRYVGGLASIFIVFLVCGVFSVARSLPFALSLGVSRRSYSFGTLGLALTLAALYGLAFAVLQVIKRATGGWGMNMGFFRVPYILDGPWYLTWLTSFVMLTLWFLWGMWFGLVYRRWSVIGLWGFIAGQVSVLTVAALLVTWAHAWDSVGHFFTTLSVAGVTGLLAVLAAALLAGGFTTMRRVTV